MLAMMYLVAVCIGKLLERINIPWIFSALFFGIFVSWFNIFEPNETFIFLGKLGMLFMLFMIGFELDTKNLKNQGKFIVTTTLFIILLDALLGSVVIRSFGYPWTIVLICVEFCNSW